MARAFAPDHEFIEPNIKSLFNVGFEGMLKKEHSGFLSAYYDFGFNATTNSMLGLDNVVPDVHKGGKVLLISALPESRDINMDPLGQFLLSHVQMREASGHGDEFPFLDLDYYDDPLGNEHVYA